VFVEQEKTFISFILTMSNIHGLHSSRNNDSDSEDDENNRFVGGIGDRGGGRSVDAVGVHVRKGCCSLWIMVLSIHTNSYDNDGNKCNDVIWSAKILTGFIHFSLPFHSGLAVRPNPEDIFQQAEGATAEDSDQVRRTITMVRHGNGAKCGNGFVRSSGSWRSTCLTFEGSSLDLFSSCLH
jgi:hypothetical protein